LFLLVKTQGLGNLGGQVVKGNVMDYYAVAAIFDGDDKLGVPFDAA
jgi:hypothetical protein